MLSKLTQDDLVWVVPDDNPRPDNYIPIMVMSKSKVTASANDPAIFKIFSNKSKAVAFASQLRKKYEVKSLRIFHVEGHSENMKE